MSEYLIMLIYGASACYLIYKQIDNSHHRMYLPIFVLCLIIIIIAPLFPILSSESVKFKYPYFIPFIIPLVAIFIIELLKRINVIEETPTAPQSPVENRDPEKIDLSELF
ncbi:hypothetical protein C2G38_2106040, partial [Gigaspora rosea]